MTAILITPFIRVYTWGIEDADYAVPLFGCLLVAAYGVQCLRVPYFRIIKAAGHYKQTQNGSIIQMIINIVFSVLLVYKYGLNGVAAGTLLAMLYHTTYFAWYLKDHILNRSFKYYIKHILCGALVIGISVFATRGFVMSDVTYLAWGVLAIKVTAVCVCISAFVNLMLNGKLIKETVLILRR